MEQGGIEGAKRRGESEEEALDRNLGELLQELRVAATGVQFLFAFLLVVPFQQGWTRITDFEQVVYFATLLATAGASICLIAPTARHRVRFRELDKRWIVESSNRLALAGLAMLALAISGAILLISDVVYGAWTAAIATTVVFGGTVAVWFIVPLMRDLRQQRG
jgi:Family of unknown function (DUF6328)